MAPKPAAKAHIVVEKRIEMLRSKLKITPDQSKAFDDFAQVMRDAANRMDTLLNTQAKGMPAMTAVDHMKAYEAITQARADDIQREVPAFSRLYDTLTPTQKKAADDSFREAASGSRSR
jgi:Mlc titration factor MtfA (ptsG expression regulator)